ncbi:uncharacterized protein LOC144094420 [Amblyomma americanum]
MPTQRSASGLGDSESGSKLIRFLFFTQVRFLENARCVRSDDRFLMLFPRPHNCGFRYVSVSLYSQLVYCIASVLLSRGVETNPGPSHSYPGSKPGTRSTSSSVNVQVASTDDACSTSNQPAINEMLAELLAGQRKMAEDIADIKRFQQRVNSRFEALESRVSALESGSPTSNGDASDGAVQPQLNSLSEVVSKLASRNDELENRSRRNNLIFHGLAEEDEETNKALFIAVTKVFIDNLQLDCPKIERYHRLGRKQEGRPRPVIVKLLDFREKTQALKNAHRLKNSGISLSEDFSAHVRLIRKKIWDATQSYRDSGSKVHLRYDHVFIDSVRYNWDDVEKSLVKDSKSTPPDTAAANATAAKPPADSD